MIALCQWITTSRTLWLSASVLPARLSRCCRKRCIMTVWTLTNYHLGTERVISVESRVKQRIRSGQNWVSGRLPVSWRDDYIAVTAMRIIETQLRDGVLSWNTYYWTHVWIERLTVMLIMTTSNLQQTVHRNNIRELYCLYSLRLVRIIEQYESHHEKCSRWF